MRLANWVDCDPPDAALPGLVQLCEHVVANEDDIQGVVEYFVHPQFGYALAHMPNDTWSVAVLDNRVDDRRVSQPGYDQISAAAVGVSEDRREHNRREREK